MPSIPDEKDKFERSSPSLTEPTSEPQAPGEFTQAFMMRSKLPSDTAEAEDQSRVSADKLKAKHDESPTEFTRLFDQFKGKELFQEPGQAGEIPVSVAPVPSRLEGVGVGRERVTEEPRSEPGAFTRAFSKMELSREIPDSGMTLEKTEPILPSAPEPQGPLEQGTPQMSDFTAAFQRALGSRSFTPKPVDRSASHEPDIFPKTELPQFGQQESIAQPPAFDWPQKTVSPLTPGEDRPGGLTTLLKGLKQAPQPGIPVHEEAGGKEAATDIFHLRQEAPSPPLVSEGPSKFTAFMKLSEMRSAEEKPSAPIAVPAAVPNVAAPNAAWPAPAQYPAMQAPLQNPPVMQTPYFVPPPPPQVAPPAAPAIPQAAPPSKLVTYLPLILILNGLVLLAILLVVLFAIKK